MRGLERTFSVARQQVAVWIRELVQGLPSLKTTLLPAKPGDVLEFDEAWSFVLKKVNKRWLWTVICRRTRQIVAFSLGDRTEKACRRLWGKVPAEYRTAIFYSDFWKRINKFYLKLNTKPSERKVGRPIIWNAGIAHCANACLAMYARHSRFLNLMLIIRWSPNGIFMTITSLSKSNNSHHLLCNHYPKTIWQ